MPDKVLNLMDLIFCDRILDMFTSDIPTLNARSFDLMPRCFSTASSFTMIGTLSLLSAAPTKR